MLTRLALTLTLLLLSGVVSAAERASTNWIGAWGFPATSAAVPSPYRPGAGAPAVADFNNVTVRQIARIAADATSLRVRISNEFGAAPLRLGNVHIAIAAADGAIVPGTDHALAFSGEASIVVPAGAPVISDPIEWRVPALTKLAVSIFVPEDTTPPAHRVTEYVSGTGNFVAQETLPNSQSVRSGAFVTAIDIASPAADRVAVTLGDSITEGFGSTVNEFRSWSDLLADRLRADHRTSHWSVVNAGINSNRLLHDNPGAGALARFDRDVLSVPGVALIVLMEGINDIGYSQTTPPEAVTAGEITAAYLQIIARAHAHGIRVVGATLMPFEDSHYYDAHGEAMRQQVNTWIRTSGRFDGVIDFDAALRDPAHPTQVLAALQRGDHLHPNDAGYERMAAAIDLKLFKP